MTISTTAGKKLYIGTKIADKNGDFVASDFTAALAAKVEIDNIENLGAIGDSTSEVSAESIGRRRTKRLKGTRTGEAQALVINYDPDDPGQKALIAAERLDDDFAFALVWNDAPAGGVPTQRLYIAQVGSISEQYDASNNVVKLNVTLWINSNFVNVPSSATVPVAPTFTTQPTITGAGAVKTATVGVVTGTLPVSFGIRWKLNGAEIARDVLTLDTTGLTGSLTVESVATNIAGAATGTSTATVLS